MKAFSFHLSVELDIHTIGSGGEKFRKTVPMTQRWPRQGANNNCSNAPSNIFAQIQLLFTSPAWWWLLEHFAILSAPGL